MTERRFRPRLAMGALPDHRERRVAILRNLLATTVLTSRVEAFSDGVIAIAITLLVLDLKVPEVHRARLGPALVEQWPTYLAYATTFITIGIMWVNHHTLFDRINRLDRTLLFANLALLGGIATLPFVTSLVAQWLREPSDAGLAVCIYCVTMLIISGGFTSLWIYLGHHRELLAPKHVDTPTRAIRRSIVGPVAYGGAAGIAPFLPGAAFVLCGLVALYFIVPNRHPAT